MNYLKEDCIKNLLSEEREDIEYTNGVIRKKNLGLLLNKIGETFYHTLKRLQT